MALTVVRPYGNSSNNGFLRRPVQRSKSNASTYSTAWSSTTDRKVLRREICCRAELNASAESSSAISASLRIDFDMRQTVSLPPSPNLRDSRRKPVDWVFASDGPSPPLFLSDCLPLSTSVTSSSYASSSSSDRRVISLLQRSPSDEENLSSGYASCESTPGTASVESNDFLFPSTTVFIDKTVMTPRPRSTSLNVFPALGSATSSTEDVTAFATLAAGDDDVRRRRWGSSSSNASSASTSSSAGSGPASRSGSPARRNNNDGGGAFLLRTVAFFVSALVLVYRKFEAVAGVRSTVFRAVVGLLKMLRPTILQRLSSGSSFSSFEEDLGFGLDEDSDDGDSGAAAAAGDRMYHERQRRQRRAEKLDAAEDLGRRIVASGRRCAGAVDLAGWLSGARSFAADHPFVTAGVGAAACTVAVPAVVAVTVVAAFLGVGFVGFLFVEGTLLTVGAIFVGSILLALGFALLTIGIGILVMYVGAANAYGLGAAVVGFVKGKLDAAAAASSGGPHLTTSSSAPSLASASGAGAGNGNGLGHLHNGGRRGWAHHHHLHHHHPPGPHRHAPQPQAQPQLQLAQPPQPQQLVGRNLRGVNLMNGFVPNQLPRTVDENPHDEATQQQQQQQQQEKQQEQRHRLLAEEDEDEQHQDQEEEEEETK